MRKKNLEDFITKAKKREIKKRPRMQIHSRGLIVAVKHAGKKITSR